MMPDQVGWNQAGAGRSGSAGKKAFVVLLIFVVIGFVAFFLTSGIGQSKFKMVEYNGASGTNYSLLFYKQYSTGKSATGSKELVSKVVENSAYPITLSITKGNANGYKQTKDCAAFPKKFEVQNNYLNQKIAVCDFSADGSKPDAEYLASISYNDQVSVILIGQDTSNKSASKTGLSTYQSDIEKILASLKVE